MHARWPRALLALFFVSSAGALGAAALVAAASGPASGLAASCSGPCPPTIDISNMAADGTVRVTYTDPQAGSEGVDPSSTSLTVSWMPQTSVPGGAPQPSPASAQAAGTCSSGQPITCDYAFPPSLMVGGYLLNGTYQLQASARDCPTVGGLVLPVNCTRQPPVSKLSSVSNPPTAPSGVMAVLEPSGVKVSWSPSPEPDIAGYRVFRNDGSFACQLSMYPGPSDYSCVDTTSGGGKFSYHVVAYRWGASYSNDPKQQPASPASAPTAAVTVPGPPATKGTTGAGLPTLGPAPFAARPSPNKLGTGGAGTGAFHATPGAHINAPAGVDTPGSGDPGFQPTLPYGQQPTTTSPDSSSIAAPASPHGGKTSVGTIAVVGAGLLIAVIALHGLWLRSEVRRSGLLEALDPEA